MEHLSDTQIRRETRSRIFLSRCNESKIDEIRLKILKAFTDDGVKLTADEVEDYYVIIRALKDCALLRCGVDSNLDETFKTTNAGKDYIRNHETANTGFMKKLLGYKVHKGVKT